MKRFAIISFLLIVLFACNSNNSSKDVDAAKDTVQTKPTIQKQASEGAEVDTASVHVWTEADKKRFLKDCQNESSENIAKNKLNDFCNCMLSEAQRYYSSYKQMDQKSDEDNDEEIFKKCVGTYGNDNDK